MSSNNESLLKFPSGLKLYMKRGEKRLDGITLRHAIGPYPVFDVAVSNPEKNRKGMVSNHLFNYFCRYYQQDHSWTDSDSAHTCPPLLSILFVAEGARKDCSIQELLDENLTPEGYAQIGASNLLAPGDPVCKTGLTSLNTVHYPAEVAPVRVSDRIAAIESRVSSNSSSSNSSSSTASEPATVVPAPVPVVVRANLTYSPTPCRICKNLSTFFVDTGGDWDCINCINCVKCASLTTEQRTLLERLGPDPVVKVNDSFPLKHHPFVGLYKDGIDCYCCGKTNTLVFDRLFDKPWSYCGGCAGFEIVQRSAATATATATVATATVESTEAPVLSIFEILERLKARKSAQKMEITDLRAISNLTIRCRKLQGRIDHRKALISTTSAEDLKKKEAALTEEFATLEKTAAQIRVVRALEKKVEEARKVAEPAEDLKKKEAALTEELATLEKIAVEVRAVRELEKRVIEARKILEEPECK